MAHNDHHEELEDDFGPENNHEEENEDDYEDSYGDEEEDENHHEHHDEELEDEDEHIYNDEEEIPQNQKEDDGKSKIKKYAIFGIGGTLLASVAYLFSGPSNQQTPNPNIRPVPHNSTMSQNNFQNQSSRPNVTVANGASLIPQQNTQSNQPPPMPLNMPNANQQQNINHNPIQYPVQNASNNYPQQSNQVQGITKSSNIYNNDSPSHEDTHEEINNIKKMIDGLHEDIHKESEADKDSIIKRIDDMQEKFENKIRSGNTISGDDTQISGIKDMISALKQSLDNANSSLKSQQDTITNLRAELNAMKQKEADEKAQKDNEELKQQQHKGQIKTKKTQKQKNSTIPISHAKENDWSPSDWKLRGYNSSKNVVIIQSPNNNYFEESIGYEARDDHGNALSGVGKLNGVEKLPSGVYVLHTSLGEIMEGN